MPTTIVCHTPRQLQELNARLFAPKTERKPKAPTPTAPASTTREPSSWTDAELIEKAKTSRNGSIFARLWAGDCSDHGGDYSRADHSKADLDLIGKLLFWTNGDASRADAMFRTSGLYREKWDERHRADGATYGEMTLEKALAGFNGDGYTGGLVYTGSQIEDETDSDGLPLNVIAQIDQLKALVTELRAVIARQDLELVQLRQLVRQNLALQQKPDKRERDSVLAALAEVESARSRGQVDERGFARLNLGEVSRCAGFSRPTVSNHLKLAAASGLCEVETRKDGYRILNKETGEVTYHPAVFAKFGDADTTRAAILDWQPERKPIGRPFGKRCSEHPDGDVRVERKVEERRFCVVCDKLLSTEQTVRQTVETYTEPETEATEDDSNQTDEAIKSFSVPACLPAISDEAPFTDSESDSNQESEAVKYFTTPYQDGETSAM